MAGAPTKLNARTRKVVLTAIGCGATYTMAAAAAGVHYDTFREWIKANPDFSDAVEKAKEVRAARWLAYIERAIEGGTWQAAAWKLERTLPETFGRTRVEHTGAGGKAIDVDIGLQLGDGDREAVRIAIETLLGRPAN